PLDRRLQVTPGEDVSRSISFHLGRKEQGVGKEADEDEHAANRQVTLLVVPLQAHTRDHAIPVDLPDPGAEDEIDAGVGPRPRLEDGLSAELTAAVDDRDPACVAGEEVSLLERRIAAPDHRQLLTLEEGAVADRAVADSPAREFRLAGHVELPRPAAGGEDQGGGVQLPPALQPGQLGAAGANLDRLHRLEFANVETELAGVVAHLAGQVPAGDRLESRVVLDQLGVEQLAADRATVDQHRLQVHAGSVEPAARPAGPPPTMMRSQLSTGARPVSAGVTASIPSEARAPRISGPTNSAISSTSANGREVLGASNTTDA